MSTDEEPTQPFDMQQFEIQQSDHIPNNIGSLYLNPKWCDVRFKVASGRRIPAHKIVLVVGSDKFGQILQDSDCIDVGNVGDAAFLEFLKFFYLSNVKVTYKNYLGVLRLGYKYNVENCIDACAEHFNKVVRPKNVCTILSFVLRHKFPRFIKFCENFIMLNTRDVFGTPEFLACHQDALAHILKMEFLSCTELEVFEACMRWIDSKSQANMDGNLSMEALIDKYLGDSIYDIRFKSMTPQELYKLATEHGSALKTKLDHLRILGMIAHPESTPERFNVPKRQLKWNDSAIIKCKREFQEADSPEYMSKLLEKETTIFSANVPLILGSFVCSRICVDSIQPYPMRSFLPIDVEISESKDSNEADNAKILCNMKMQLKSTDENVFLLPSPLLIRPEYFYTISVHQFPDQHIHHSREMMREIRFKDTNNQPSDIVIKFHHHKLNDEHVNVGLISTLNFNRL